MHLPAAGRHLLLEALEIEVEMGQRVVLDDARFIAELVEFRQPRDRRGAVHDETGLHLRERALQVRLDQRVSDILLEESAGRFHRRYPSSRPSPMAASSVMPASTSAT